MRAILERLRTSSISSMSAEDDHSRQAAGRGVKLFVLLSCVAGQAILSASPVDAAPPLLIQTEALRAATAGTVGDAGNQPPAITAFSVGNFYEDWWVIWGFVEDEDPGYCIISFGGCLEGDICTVEEDGSFCHVVYLADPQYEGLVTAQTRDDHGQLSNIAKDIIVRY